MRVGGLVYMDRTKEGNRYRIPPNMCIRGGGVKGCRQDVLVRCVCKYD